ncbi:NAD/NADP-dependent indole-3-acetaldehyde reductase [Ceratocystis lukuohia]|uniref:NAD/NADP-dependent indole-3-acetaldehyde reductase n=2 Tax=Ceratocystis TaxID=5157 RepID=A0A0F8CS81_CERFI|nr:NAD/NADP-dependent indole-3-acetaldehyde reductase [Ceratocystis platani]
MSLPTVTLSSGHKVPALAYGLGTKWFKTTPGQLDQKTMDGVRLALKLGYRHLDGAQVYNNEAEVGSAVAESGVPRSELFITTKAKEYGNIENSLEQSLKLLKTDYVDLYLIHNPFGATIEQLRDAWKGMESVAKRGLAKSIGVSNFGILQLQAVLDVATIIPSINQIELHPYLPQDELRAFMKQKGVGLEAYGPVTPLSRAAPGPVDPVVQRLARKYGVSDTSVLLRWVIDQGYLAVSTSGSEERLKAMITEVPSFELTDDEVKELLQVGRGKTYRHFMASHFKAMGIEP